MQAQQKTKTVLVSFKGRRRAVTFTSSPNETADLLRSFSEVFCDVLQSDEAAQNIVWQIKDKDWKGEFVDVWGGKENFPDRAVLKALLTGDQDVVVGSVSTKLVVNILINWAK